MTLGIAQLLVVGGGPAGSAVLLAASRVGALRELCAGGLVIVEQGRRLGAGSLGRYDINSDSTAGTFLASVVAHPDPRVAMAAEGAAGRAMAAQPAQSAVRLSLAAAFIDDVGAAVQVAAATAGARILTGHTVLGLQREQNVWVARLRAANGATETVLARNVVIATGGVQGEAETRDIVTAGGPLGAICGERLMLSDALLVEGGVAALSARLAAVGRPRVAVLGGSTSALAAVKLVLASDVGARLEPGGLALVHRRKLRPFYRTATDARLDGFSDFVANDICPVSGFVYRLGGLRLDAREIVLRALQVGGRKPDRRLRLVRPAESALGLRALQAAHVVIAATGYRPRALPVAAADGTPIRLRTDNPRVPMVDGACRVLDAAGAPLPGLYGIGLAAGFVPHGAMGGEKSFVGQANGLWLWQNDVGAMIIEQVRREPGDARRLVA